MVDKTLHRESREEAQVRAEAWDAILLGAQEKDPLTLSQCLQDAKWANSDILLVSDGELRQPGQEVMRSYLVPRTSSACASMASLLVRHYEIL